MPSDPAIVLLLERLLVAIEGLRADLAASKAPPAVAPAESLWGVGEVAQFVGCSRSKLYQWAAAGKIPSLHVGGQLRFEPEAVRRWARGEAVRPATVVSLAKAR